MIIPDWPAPKNIHAFTTTRAARNYAAAENKRLIVNDFQLPAEPCWLKQIHTANVVEANDQLLEADASYTKNKNTVCAVLTADCLPILLCDKAGTQVAAIHAGWRSLAAGIITNTLQYFVQPRDQLMAWLGPAIGPDAFEVGRDVYTAFCQQNAEHQAAFISTGTRWLANIYQLARHELAQNGLSAVYGGNHCTVNDAQFFSYRRDKTSERMTTLIWIKKQVKPAQA